MKKSFKEECKDFWKENKEKIKIGIKCLAVGFACGFIKGGNAFYKIDKDEIMRLLDKIPDREKIKDDDKILHQALMDRSKEDVNALMDEMVDCDEMRP